MSASEGGATVADWIDATVAWLDVHFPTPFPVTVRWRKRVAVHKSDRANYTRSQLDVGYMAEIEQFSRSFTITLSRRRCRTLGEAIETLWHEWCHAATTRHDRVERTRHPEGHDDEFWLLYGRIYRLWHDDSDYIEVRRAAESLYRQRIARRRSPR